MAHPLLNPPPAGEQIHLPESSLLPLGVAIGLTTALVGLLFGWIVVGAGALIVAISARQWVRLAVSEAAALPLTANGPGRPADHN